MRLSLRLFAPLVAVWIGAVVSATAQPARVMTLDDAREVVRVSDPRISPDGRTVLVTVARADLEVNEWRGTLVAVDVATGAERPVAAGLRNVGQPRWSPSGDRIAV
ncbi:MAG: S9 family peptidase, partial [Vicinamibacteria bacterium]